MPIHMSYTKERGLCVYENTQLMYRPQTQDEIRQLQLALLWDVPVTLNGLTISDPYHRAELSVMAALAFKDGLSEPL